MATTHTRTHLLARKNLFSFAAFFSLFSRHANLCMFVVYIAGSIINMYTRVYISYISIPSREKEEIKLKETVKIRRRYLRFAISSFFFPANPRFFYLARKNSVDLQRVSEGLPQERKKTEFF